MKETFNLQSFIQKFSEHKTVEEDIDSGRRVGTIKGYYHQNKRSKYEGIYSFTEEATFAETSQNKRYIFTHEPMHGMPAVRGVIFENGKVTQVVNMEEKEIRGYLFVFSRSREFRSMGGKKVSKT